MNLVASTRDALAWLKQTVPHAKELWLDSRRVQRGDVFVAVPGARSDGRQFLDAARAQGAAAALIDAKDWLTDTNARELDMPALLVQDLRQQLGILASAFYGEPSAQLRAIGVTGTNGKTSTTQWIAQLLTHAGQRCGVIGTVGVGFPDEPLSNAELTTPDAVSLQRCVRDFVEAGAQALAMEVSSIGLDQGRVDGMQFDIALFTNLTRDHLDYHGTMEHYEAAKAKLFDWPTLTHAVINLDDAAGQRLLQRVDSRVPVIGYTQSDAQAPDSVQRLSASDFAVPANGLQFTVSDGQSKHLIRVPLVGMFNVSNVLGVLGVAMACGISLADACLLLPKLTPPTGRMQRVSSGLKTPEPLAVVDYAHTPDALEKALTALHPVAEARGGQLWVVFGAGGDRDPGKRAPMGAAAARGADSVIITSDNPRSEDPAQIAAQVAAGVADVAGGAYQIIVDRAVAIRAVLTQVGVNDVVLIAGKGHEDYQDIGGRKLPFSDVEHAREALLHRAAKAGGAC